MTHKFSRYIALAIVTLSMTTPMASAYAAADQPTRAPEFTVDVFPHQGQAVNFWDSWGAKRSGGRRHQGIDIMSPRGTNIVAVADGVVTAMDWHSMSGYFIRIAHDDGWMSVYMHLNNDRLGTDDGEGGTWSAFSPLLKEGDAVKAGDLIGYVGDSGNAEGTRAHTHFELRNSDTKVNPHEFLVEAWGRQQLLTAESGLPF
jgi:murein DD-endopeptidase MepM/ murein hydrolase activator NlpD